MNYLLFVTLVSWYPLIVSYCAVLSVHCSLHCSTTQQCFNLGLDHGGLRQWHQQVNWHKELFGSMAFIGTKESKVLMSSEAGLLLIPVHLMIINNGRTTTDRINHAYHTRFVDGRQQEHCFAAPLRCVSSPPF